MKSMDKGKTKNLPGHEKSYPQVTKKESVINNGLFLGFCQNTRYSGRNKIDTLYIGVDKQKKKE